MKKVFLFLLVTLAVFSSCSNDTTTLSVNTDTIAASVTANTYIIEVTSNSEWTATVDSGADWCTISPSSATGNGTITVSVAENTATIKRSTTITIASGWFTQQVIVTQQAGIEIEMVTVAGGTTTLNGTNVTISSFQIGKYEVTEKQWWDVMGSWSGEESPTLYADVDDNFPMCSVSHDDIQSFLVKLNQRTGKNYRLPTEAEWEYAAKGGQSTHNYTYSGSNTLNYVACWYGNSNYSQYVGIKQANELGIYDMSGNVFEWCSDWYGSSYPSSTNNPTGATSGLYRVMRGGGWNNVATYCRVSYRSYGAPSYRFNNVGFRLVLPL